MGFAPSFISFVKSTTTESRLRLAPTPSGFLHLGNGMNFILNWLLARNLGQDNRTKGEAIPTPNSLFLRIDDLDVDRSRPAYLQDIFDSLEWLQLDWVQPPVYQSDPSRKPLYESVLTRLRALDILFACRKSRRDLESFGGHYPLEFRQQGLDLDMPDVAWRIKTPPGFPLADFVVRRRDGIPAYQVASFADDLQMGITHIIRGADLEDSTHAQRFLAEVLLEEAFLQIQFLHHPLVLGHDGEKLSKSAGSISLKGMRDAEIGPDNVFRTAAQWLGIKGDFAEELFHSMKEKLK